MPDYFTLDELRALPQMGDTVKYPDDRVEAAAAYIVGIIEREVDTAFVSRTVTNEIHDGGGATIVLDHADVTAVTTLTVDGVAVDPSNYVVTSGVVRLTSGVFGAGIGNVSVTYTYSQGDILDGVSFADVKEVALKGTRAHLLATGQNTAMDDRRTSLNTEAGTISFTVAGTDHPTGYPEVDATIVAWRNRVGGLGGFA